MNYAKDYAEKVVAGKIIAGKKVILAAERYLTDLKKADNDDFEYFYGNTSGSKNDAGVSFSRFSTVHHCKYVWLVEEG